MTIDLDEIERLHDTATIGSKWWEIYIDYNFECAEIFSSLPDSDCWTRVTDITPEICAYLVKLHNAAPELLRLARIGKEAEELRRFHVALPHVNESGEIDDAVYYPHVRELLRLAKLGKQQEK
jgi:hypothetical protein